MSDQTPAVDRYGVLFVCHANICRSPLAAGVLTHWARVEGVLDRLWIDSAGTWAAEGIAPHPLSVQIARRHGLDLASLDHRSRSIGPRDLERFAEIVVMDRRNLADVNRLRRISFGGRTSRDHTARVSLLRHFANATGHGADSDVPDPVRGGPEQFERMFNIVTEGCQALLHALITHGLLGNSASPPSRG